MTNTETLAKAEQAAYDERIKVLEQRQGDDVARDAEILSVKERHAAAQVGIAERQAQLEANAHITAMNQISGALGQAAALMDKNNRQQFNMWKVFATSQATVNAMLGFTNILADKSVDLMFGGPGYRIAMASTVLGLGMAQAAKIASTPFGGGGGGGGGGGSVGSSGGSAKSMSSGEGGGQNTGGQSNVRVNLYGSNFSADQVRGLIGAINSQAGDNMTLKAQVMS
jgi:hypothetical protein